MSIKLPEVNINGELVNIRDIKKVVELLTKPSKAKPGYSSSGKGKSASQDLNKRIVTPSYKNK